MTKNVEIVKVDDSRPCYICQGKTKECRACGGTGIFNEYHYNYILTDKNGDKIAFSSDNLA